MAGRQRVSAGALCEDAGEGGDEGYGDRDFVAWVLDSLWAFSGQGEFSLKQRFEERNEQVSYGIKPGFILNPYDEYTCFVTIIIHVCHLIIILIDDVCSLLLFYFQVQVGL